MVSWKVWGFKNCSQHADRLAAQVASWQVLLMVECITGTGIKLWRFLEGADERLP
jgi:hypothetical protein